MFTLKHQNEHEDQTFIFTEGGFSIIDSKLYIWLETKAASTDSDTFPECYNFALDGYPLNITLENASFKISAHSPHQGEERQEDGSPYVCVYAEYHISHLEVTISTEVISLQEIQVSLNIVSEDVRYSINTGKKSTFIGTVKLEEKAISEMWI